VNERARFVRPTPIDSARAEAGANSGAHERLHRPARRARHGLFLQHRDPDSWPSKRVRVQQTRTHTMEQSGKERI